ncbi:hypothetical protein LPJ71_002626, partial [Coemansia sp. S17]
FLCIQGMIVGAIQLPVTDARGIADDMHMYLLASTSTSTDRPEQDRSNGAILESSTYWRATKPLCIYCLPYNGLPVHNVLNSFYIQKINMIV